MGGFTQAMSGDMSEVVGFLKAGEVRVLAVLTDERVPGFEDIPTAIEQGYDVTAVNWRGMYVPKGISDEQFNVWAEKLQAVADSAEWQEAMAANGLAPFTKVGVRFPELRGHPRRGNQRALQGTGSDPVMASDRIFGLVTLFVALAYIAGATQIQTSFLADPVGPKAFPILIGAVAALCSLYMIVRPDPDPDWPSARTWGALLVAVIVLVAYAYALKPMGFIVPTAIAAGDSQLPDIPESQGRRGGGLRAVAGSLHPVQIRIGIEPLRLPERNGSDMELMSNLALGFSIALSPYTLLLAVVGCFLGTIIGALPGLGPSNGVAILIPLTFTLGLDATSALVLMTSVYYGAMYGGRISSILLNIPGDEPALMTTLDGYPMAKQGRAGDALVLSGVASFVGAFLATIGLMLLAPMLARVAYLFGPAEYFALYLLAFCTLGGMASNNQAKAALASCLGLGIAMIGVDSSSGMPRLTGGNLHLFDGIDFLVAIVGLFAIAEVFFFIESHGKGSSIGVVLDKVRIPWKDIRDTKWTMLRASGVGFIAGILPGAGASLGSFLAYMSEKSIAGKNGGFGTGAPKGVAAPEAGNNAAAGGALVPMLTLGVPGSGTTAVLLALLMTLNITPGPTLFTDRPEVVWGLIASLLIANIVLLLMNVPMVKVFVKILMVPAWVLLPGVTMISFVGIYSLSGSYFDLLLMVAFGALGYILRKLDVPTVPVILGILLGGNMEDALRRAMVLSDGDFTFLFSTPISIGLWIAAILGFVAPMFLRNVLKKPQAITD